MKVAHADDQQPTLVGLGDTQQIREIGAANRRTRRCSQAVKAGLADPRRDSDRGCAGGGRPRHGDPFVRVVARRRRGSPGADRPPGRDRTTRSPRCAWATGAGRGNGAGRSEGGNRSHGPAGSRRRQGRPVLGARPVRLERPERAARSSRAQRLPELRCSRRSTRLSARASLPRRPAPKVQFALGGGAQVSAPGLSSKSVALRSSYPTSTNGWRAVGSVIAPLGAGEQMTVRPYVLCGKTSRS